MPFRDFEACGEVIPLPPLRERLLPRSSYKEHHAEDRQGGRAVASHGARQAPRAGAGTGSAVEGLCPPLAWYRQIGTGQRLSTVERWPSAASKRDEQPFHMAHR